MSDSLKVEVTGQTLERLKRAFELCTCFEESPNTLIFMSWEITDHVLKVSHYNDLGSPFPIAMPSDLAASIAYSYVMGLPASKWPKEPDIDGECTRGWILHFAGYQVTISPYWMIHHK